MKYFVTAIGTGSGKTIISALLLHLLKGEYWKPIQSGIEEVDSDEIRSLAPLNTVIHSEVYKFKFPASPNISAQREGKEIDLKNIKIPNYTQPLIIEGAGGLLVPLNNKGLLMADLIEELDGEVILVCDLYLGAINHTLLTISEIKRRGMKLKGWVVNRGEDVEVLTTLKAYIGCEPLFVLNTFSEKITRADLEKLAKEIQWK